MIVVGVDVHKHSLTAVAVDELGRPLQEYAGSVDEGVLAWTRSLDEERLWALEDCRHVTRGLEQAQVAAGERLVWVAAAAGGAAAPPQPHTRQVGRDRRARDRPRRARATQTYGCLTHVPCGHARSVRSATMAGVAVQRMDNVGIVVESLDAAVSFFAELGLELEGRAVIEGDWSGRVTGLRDQRVETAMMRMPDGHGRIELSRFLTPPVVADHRNAPVNALGYLRVMFAVDDLDDTLARLRRHGAQLVDEVVQYEDVYRLCYVRGPEGILIGLAEQIG
jgi:catechol 2,3-dioxygenase-like lactoylglutathione lyase family enzyme